MAEEQGSAQELDYKTVQEVLLRKLCSELGIPAEVISAGTPPAQVRPPSQVWRPPADHMTRPPTRQEVWDMVAGSERLLRKRVARFLPRNRRGELDELYSDVVIGKAHEIMLGWRPGKRSWLTYLCRMLQWRSYKWVHNRNGHWGVIKNDKSTEKLGDKDYDIECHRDKGGAALGVYLMLEHLSAEDQRLIRWRVIEGYDFDEIAVALSVRRVQASKMFKEALSRARESAWLDGPAGDFLREILDDW